MQRHKKSYGTQETRVDALKGIDLEIEASKLTLLVGPSGSGKTTLISIITTILTPDEGELFLLDHEISRMNDNERARFCLENLGIVFQSLFLIPTLTVAENVSLPLLVAGHPPKVVSEKTLEILKTLKVDQRRDSSPMNLSKGQQQRVAIARALVNNSKILICDEPTSALDQAAGLEIMTVLKELSTQALKTVMIVTHDPRTFSFADRMVHINDGQIDAGAKNE